MSDLYESKMSLLDNVKPDDLLLFVCNFNTILAASGTLEVDAKFQYLCTLVRGEALHQFDLLSDYVEGTEILHVYYIIRGLAQYFTPVNFLSKYTRAMRRGMKNRAI